MDAAGGVYVGKGGAVSVYGGFHWRRGHEIHVVEFRPEIPADAPAVTQPADAWVDLYEKPYFRGRRLSVLGKRGTQFADYRKIRVQNRGFGDNVSSIRYQIPTGMTYRLFREPKFEVKGPDSTFDLHGKGTVVEHPDLDEHDFDEVVSSSKYV